MPEPTRLDRDAFAREAARGPSSIPREVWEYLRRNKKWWLVPILVGLFVNAILIALGSSALAPFTYPLF